MSLKDTMELRAVLPEQCGELTDKTVAIKRVAKVVKGGRRFSFAALVATGDGQGHVGFGLGKALEVPDAIRKASECARISLVRIPLRGTTIPHEVVGKFGSTSVVLKPAGPGTGVIAGSAVRAIMELCGIKDIRTKVIGSSNAKNVVQGSVTGLLSLMEPDSVASMRNVNMEDLGYHPY